VALGTGNSVFVKNDRFSYGYHRSHPLAVQKAFLAFWATAESTSRP
jgi:hypothetical protein